MPSSFIVTAYCHQPPLHTGTTPNCQNTLLSHTCIPCPLPHASPYHPPIRRPQNLTYDPLSVATPNAVPSHPIIRPHRQAIQSPCTTAPYHHPVGPPHTLIPNCHGKRLPSHTTHKGHGPGQSHHCIPPPLLVPLSPVHCTRTVPVPSAHPPYSHHVVKIRGKTHPHHSPPSPHTTIASRPLKPHTVTACQHLVRSIHPTTPNNRCKQSDQTHTPYNCAIPSPLTPSRHPQR